MWADICVNCACFKLQIRRLVCFNEGRAKVVVFFFPQRGLPMNIHPCGEAVRLVVYRRVFVRKATIVYSFTKQILWPLYSTWKEQMQAYKYSTLDASGIAQGHFREKTIGDHSHCSTKWYCSVRNGLALGQTTPLTSAIQMWPQLFPFIFQNLVLFSKSGST